MPFLEAIATGFFRLFGITQPSPEHLRRASWFLLALMVISVTAIALIGVLLSHLMHS
jgi:hypothetical protein